MADTSQPQPGLTLRDRLISMMYATRAEAAALLDEYEALVAKAQRDESAKALTEYALTYNDAAMSFAAEFVRNEPLITEATR